MIYKVALMLVLASIEMWQVAAQSLITQPTSEVISEVGIRGNSRVESAAILNLMASRVGTVLSASAVRADTLKLYELGYFSDIRVYKETSSSGTKIIVQVKEKPAITSISFEGMEEVTESDLKDKLETKLYTIVNDAALNRDLRIIEKSYTEKGFYLSSATYRLDVKEKSNEVALTFMVSEGSKVMIGDVHILGNEYFSDAELLEKFASRPMSRLSFMGPTGSIYQDEFLQRDLEILALYYREYGFAKVQVAKPIAELDRDRKFARLTFQVEEGLQYNVGTLDISGDLLFEKDELFEKMLLKEGELFRYNSRFRADIDMLIDAYGDLGFAFVDVNPRMEFDDDKKLVSINYEITKGEKVYFGDLLVTGNTKTRDNVIRREFEINDGELYSGKKLRDSKTNLERLGYFEEVQAIRQRDPEEETVLDYKFKVKERPTGQLQAALGYQPGQGQGENNFFGQGRYSEENQSGKGWQTALSARWNGGKNYDFTTSFTDPRVNDSWWSLGFSLFLRNQIRQITDTVDIQESRVGGSLTLGRRVIELIRALVTYRLVGIEQESDVFILPKFQNNGLASSVIFSLRRNATNSLIDPTDGSDLQLSHEFTGGALLGGDQQYMESSAEGSIYLPLRFSETYVSFFHIRAMASYVFRYGNKEIPFLQRYRMGGPQNMRGYEFNELGPYFNVLLGADAAPTRLNAGGDKQTLFQFEYFIPLIPEAGIRAVLFADAGNVFDDDEEFGVDGLRKDIGFGFRWITPIAPFRFEWAYPYENGRMGDLQFIFFLGY